MDEATTTAVVVGPTQHILYVQAMDIVGNWVPVTATTLNVILIKNGDDDDDDNESGGLFVPSPVIDTPPLTAPPTKEPTHLPT